MRRVLRLGSVIAALLAIASTSGAQTATGQITGTVKDSSGAVMPKVKVVVTNALTGLTRETTSNDSGDYSFRCCPSAPTSSRQRRTGFKLAVSSDNELKVDQVLRVDLSWSRGAHRERGSASGGRRARHARPPASARSSPRSRSPSCR